MPRSDLPSQPRRSHLASFENAYAVAVQLRAASGLEHFIVQTGNPLQPYRVARERPIAPEIVQALVA